MTGTVKGVIRHVAGWGALLVGVAGLFLPILQGWLFIGLGALLLSPDVPLFRRLVEWIERHFPTLRPAIRGLRKKLNLHR
ncbi:MAG TPA: PGPGW domain-containing protein [Thermoanaerobaculaceae bacterium]|nr:PGPGW domain-containing protein [Thermoanaerobaculaceae bacterium]